MSVSDKGKKASLERLKNSLEQAKVDGNTKLVKQLEAIIKRVRDGKT